jgi:RNA polymerase sigma-70 factor (ECF subfamily)
MESVEQLFKLHYAFVCNVINRYVRDRYKSEDIAQDIFAELWMKRDQLVFHTSVTAYLRKMAITRALNFIRDSKKHQWDDLEDTTCQEADGAGREPEILQKIE